MLAATGKLNMSTHVHVYSIASCDKILAIIDNADITYDIQLNKWYTKTCVHGYEAVRTCYIAIGIYVATYDRYLSDKRHT